MSGHWTIRSTGDIALIRLSAASRNRNTFQEYLDNKAYPQVIELTGIGTIKSVQMLGVGQVDLHQTEAGLMVSLPEGFAPDMS